MKQKDCKQELERQNDEETKKSLLEALRQCGTSLIRALVIGFDMESEGIPNALTRVFPWVSSAFLEGVEDFQSQPERNYNMGHPCNI